MPTVQEVLDRLSLIEDKTIPIIGVNTSAGIYEEVSIYGDVEIVLEELADLTELEVGSKFLPIYF